MYVHADNISTCNVEQSNYIKENPKTVSVHCFVTAPRPQFQSQEVETLHAALTHEGAGY